MSDRLKKYGEKRDFKKTVEPTGIGGESEAREGNLRFVVQYHASRRVHYDFRLEWKGVLLSWAVPKGLSYNPQDKRLAVQVEDHPFEYRNFEGVIPQGQYGGGSVMIWDEGFWLGGADADNALAVGKLKFALLGKRLVGEWVLLKLKENEQQNNWLIIKENDKYAKTESGTTGFVTSVRTGRTIDGIVET